MRCFHCMKEIKEHTKFCPYCGNVPNESNPTHYLASGSVLIGKYLIGNALGEGGFGITYIGYDLDSNRKAAVKEYFPNGYANRNNTLSNEITLNLSNHGEYFKNGRESFLREAKSIARFSDESVIVNVRDFFTANNTAYIVMEYLDGVNLNRYLAQHGVMNAVTLMKRALPLIAALGKIHRAGIVHRDISPDNIMLLKYGSLKLMDFGSARHFSNNEVKTMSVLLKPGYAPYEQYSRKGKQGPWTDVYGLCATLYKCITGVTPSDSLDRCREDDLKKPSEMGIRISPALENAIMSGLTVFPESRCQNMESLERQIRAALEADGMTAQSVDENVTQLADDAIDGRTAYSQSNAYRPAGTPNAPTFMQPSDGYNFYRPDNYASRVSAEAPAVFEPARRRAAPSPYAQYAQPLSDKLSGITRMAPPPDKDEVRTVAYIDEDLPPVKLAYNETEQKKESTAPLALLGGLIVVVFIVFISIGNIAGLIVALIISLILGIAVGIIYGANEKAKKRKALSEPSPNAPRHFVRTYMEARAFYGTGRCIDDLLYVEQIDIETRDGKTVIKFPQNDAPFTARFHKSMQLPTLPYYGNCVVWLLEDGWEIVHLY